MNKIEKFQDEINAREKLGRDRHDFVTLYDRLKEQWGDHIWLSNHLNEMILGLMSK